jgi:hypothetical protein
MKDIPGHIWYAGNVIEFYHVDGEELLSDPYNDSWYQHESHNTGKEIRRISDGNNSEMLVDFHQIRARGMKGEGNADL